jgi:hypothetical protein
MLRTVLVNYIGFFKTLWGLAADKKAGTDRSERHHAEKVCYGQASIKDQGNFSHRAASSPVRRVWFWAARHFSARCWSALLMWIV